MPGGRGGGRAGAWIGVVRAKEKKKRERQKTLTFFSHPPSFQAIKLVERVLYAADEAEAKAVLAEVGVQADGGAA